MKKTITDQQLAHALVHEANLILSAMSNEDEIQRVKELLHLAELILGGSATDTERQRVYDLVAPSTVHHYLSS